MKKFIVAVAIALVSLTGCMEPTKQSQEKKDQQTVQRQQAQYGAAQPVPMYDWSLVRHMVIQLQDAQNVKALTHSVWRSNTGMIEGDCVSMGYGIPYDTSLTNPLQTVLADDPTGIALATIEQAEPNGIFASKNTSATWVMCVDESGTISPVYVEAKVTAYPWNMDVNYETNRVKRMKGSQSSVTFK